MGIYIFMIITVFLLGLLAKYNTKNKILSNIFGLSAFMILFVISGARYGVGTDYWTYRNTFIQSASTNLIESRDFGYLLLNKIIFQISENPRIIFWVTSFIINGLIVYTLVKKSKAFELSIYLYITTFMYFSTFNTIRQWMATAILFAGIKYFLDRNFLKYSLVILLASTIHQTALIMFLFYFICNCSFKSKRIILITIVGVFIFINYMPFVNFLMEFLEGTKFHNDYNGVLNQGGFGSNSLKVIVAMVPVILSLIFYKAINNENDRKIDILMNMSLINMLIMLIGTRHWIFARFLMYFEIYNLLLYPIIISKIVGKERKLLYYGLIVFYFAFCILILASGDSNIVPYRVG